MFAHHPSTVHPTTGAPCPQSAGGVLPAEYNSLHTPLPAPPLSVQWDPAMPSPSAPEVDTLCKVCSTAQATHYTAFCGHKCVCKECSEKMGSARSRRSSDGWLICPECGGKIHGFVPGRTPPKPPPRNY